MKTVESDFGRVWILKVSSTAPWIVIFLSINSIANYFYSEFYRDYFFASCFQGCCGEVHPWLVVWLGIEIQSKPACRAVVENWVPPWVLFSLPFHWPLGSCWPHPPSVAKENPELLTLLLRPPRCCLPSQEPAPSFSDLLYVVLLLLFAPRPFFPGSFHYLLLIVEMSQSALTWAFCPLLSWVCGELRLVKTDFRPGNLLAMAFAWVSHGSHPTLAFSLLFSFWNLVFGC